MNIETLVGMANDIGNFFDSDGGAGEAPKEIASHITRFWEPRMRFQIIEHEQEGGEGLSPSARAAVKLLVKPPPRQVPVAAAL